MHRAHPNIVAIDYLHRLPPTFGLLLLLILPAPSRAAIPLPAEPTFEALANITVITSQAWGVGARGFGGQFANQLLGRADGGGTPRHKLSLRSTHELGHHWSLDAGLRYMDALRSVIVPSYFELDLRLAWKPNAYWDIALVGQNLLHPHHAEFPPGLTPTLLRVPRAVYAQLTWKR